MLLPLSCLHKHGFALVSAFSPCFPSLCLSLQYENTGQPALSSVPCMKLGLLGLVCFDGMQEEMLAQVFHGTCCPLCTLSLSSDAEIPQGQHLYRLQKEPI